MKSAAWIQSLSGLPFRTMADPIMAADQAIAHSTSLVNDCLEDEIIFFPISLSVHDYCRHYTLLFSRKIMPGDTSFFLKGEIASQFDLKAI